MRSLAAIIITLFLSGCMVGPDYHRPPLDVPDSFHYEISDAQENALNLEWWTQFDDPVLTDLITEGLANNKDIKIAAANIENAIGIMIQTRAPLFAQLGYSGFFNRIRNSKTLAGPSFPVALPISIPNPQTTWQLALNNSWQIDIWGRVRRLTEAADANIYATYEARQNIILSLVASIANSYIELRAFDEQLVISINTMKVYEEEVRYFEAQFKYGQASQMAVAQAKTQYEIAASQIPQIQLQIVETENAISVLLGRNPGPIARGKPIEDLKLPIIPADLPSDLLCQRPDIMQAEQQLVAANAQIGAAKALYFPTITLTGLYGTASQNLNQLFSGPSNTWNFTGSITGPIFTGGAIYGQVIQAESQDQAALVNYEKVIQNAFAEVENALAARTLLSEELESQKRLVEAAGDYVRLSTLQYKGGYSPYFVVIQAQQQYFPAQLSLTQTRAQLFSAIVNIYATMGGGWVNTAESMTLPCECECECEFTAIPI